MLESEVSNLTCFHPNYIRFRTYKKPLGFIPEHFKLIKDSNRTKVYQFVHDYGMNNYFKDYHCEDNSIFTEELVSVPCGKCVGCSCDYSKQWATRCYLESTNWSDNYFITLTYDDDHLSYGNFGNATLVKDDLKKFIKDLRNFYMNHFNHVGVRYFACGEYGKGFRPHYHLILFNLPIPDLSDFFPFLDDDGNRRFIQKVKLGNVYYWSKIISDIWGKGNIVIGKCSFQSCAYTARYVVKKAKGKDKEKYDQLLGICPEFVMMSNRPGIGANYCLDNINDLIYFDSVIVPSGDKVVSQSLPRYFMKIIQREDPLAYDSLVNDHKVRLSDSLFTKYNLNFVSYKEQLEFLEESMNSKLLMLNREV